MKVESFFGYDNFMPHGMCYLWQPEILWTSVVSDVTTALAYYSITAGVIWFVKKRHDLPYPWFFILAGSVIFLACGTSHLISAIVIWEPVYGISAISKAITAITSLATGIIIWFVLPFFIALPSPSMLKKKNQALQDSLNKLNVAQKNVIESQRLASLGCLVTGMAHELNTPIGICITATSYIDDEIKSAKIDCQNTKKQRQLLSKLQEGTALIWNNLEHTRDLVNLFKDVSAEKLPEQESRVRLAEFVTDLFNIFVQKFEMSATQVTINCSSNIEVNCNPNALIHILSNLFTNSVVHGFDTQSKGKITLSISAEKNNSLQIIYRDNGTGMNAEQLEKIFDPFYTTKRGKGRPGLGMTIVFNTITSLDGTIICQSIEGDNTTFTIDLPLAIFIVKDTSKAVNQLSDTSTVAQ